MTGTFASGSPLLSARWPAELQAWDARKPPRKRGFSVAGVSRISLLPFNHAVPGAVELRSFPPADPRFSSSRPCLDPDLGFRSSRPEAEVLAEQHACHHEGRAVPLGHRGADGHDHVLRGVRPSNARARATGARRRYRAVLLLTTEQRAARPTIRLRIFPSRHQSDQGRPNGSTQ